MAYVWELTAIHRAALIGAFDSGPVTDKESAVIGGEPDRTVEGVV